MRIISGKHKNRRIETQLKGSKVYYRPTTDRTRQAVFNILGPLGGEVVADICCGSGAFGLEALSRGASKAYFVDVAPDQVALAAANATSLGEAGASVFITCNATSLTQAQSACDIVFVDPPYNLNMLTSILDSLLESGWVNNNTLIIAETAKRERVEISKFSVMDERIYGKTKLLFLRAV